MLFRPSTQSPPAIRAFSPQETGFAALLMLSFSTGGGALFSLTHWPEYVIGLAGAATLQVGILTGTAVILAGRKLSWRDAFNLQPSYWPAAIRAGLFGCAIVIALAALLTLFSALLLTKLGVQTDGQPPLRWFQESNSPLFQNLFLAEAILLAPFAEELFFRGLLLPLLLHRLSTPAAVILSSLLFAGFHFHAPSFLSLFAVAIVCAVAYLRTRSLAAPIILHAAYNLVNLSWVMLRQSG